MGLLTFFPLASCKVFWLAGKQIRRFGRFFSELPAESKTCGSCTGVLWLTGELQGEQC